MLRYTLAALALKTFSANEVGMKGYRLLGNFVGQRIRKRKTYVDAYIQRGNLFLDLSEKYGITKDGDNLLEIGTGWLHMHSIYHRLFNKVRITMLDIWDCRQFEAIAPVFKNIGAQITKQLENNEAARKTLDQVVTATSIDKLYADLGLDYVVEKNGSLSGFQDESLDCVFSFHVLEHVPKENTKQLCSDILRILKPGGFSVHQIGIDDHLRHYDLKESPKNYLKYSDQKWKILYDNKLQYVNRIQMSEWLKMFEEAGFTLLECIPEYCDIGTMKVSPRFENYSKEDLRCTMLTIVHQKTT